VNLHIEVEEPAGHFTWLLEKEAYPAGDEKGRQIYLRED